MIWKEFLKKIAAELAQYLENDIQYSGIPQEQIRQSAWREVELFIENFKHWPPGKLILKENSAISVRDQNKISKFLKERLKGKPLAYIIGKQRFYGVDIKVNKNVLIPRPETEELVKYALERIKNNSVLIDVGTGSGCILAAILNNLPKDVKLSAVYAVDKNENALRLAKQNLGSNKEIKYIAGPLLPKIKSKNIVIILANLPYLSVNEYAQLSPEVRKYEPKSALIGGEEGHELICRLVDQVYAAKIDFEMFLEISPTIFPKIKKHLAKRDVEYQLKADLSGKTRIIRLSSRCRKC